MNPPLLADFAHIDPVPCPCGFARRAFAGVPYSPVTLHVTEITRDAQRHYHREHTEIYYILECEPAAQIELDGQLDPVHPGAAILIPPGVRHRALGPMKVMIVSHPQFDPDDEWLD
jgi:quercetin dioxygenase-like cupin family protein